MELDRKDCLPRRVVDFIALAEGEAFDVTYEYSSSSDVIVIAIPRRDWRRQLSFAFLPHQLSLDFDAHQYQAPVHGLAVDEDPLLTIQDLVSCVREMSIGRCRPSERLCEQLLALLDSEAT